MKLVLKKNVHCTSPSAQTQHHHGCETIILESHWEFNVPRNTLAPLEDYRGRILAKVLIGKLQMGLATLYHDTTYNFTIYHNRSMSLSIYMWSGKKLRRF